MDSPTQGVGRIASRLSRRGRQALGLGLCAALIEAGLLSLLRLGRLADHVPEFLTHYLFLAIPYVVACWIVTRRVGTASSATATRWIWAAAIFFRLTVLPMAPSLSEDTVRYRWQGMLQQAGGDPYVDVPEDRAWLGLRDETWPRVASKDKPSAYGPLIEQVNHRYYGLASIFSADPWSQVWLFKLPFALADIAVGLALVSLLAAAGIPQSRAVVYLWSPLALSEFWIEGHNDSLAVAFVVAALALSLRKRPDWAVVSLALATLCKFWPAVLFPFLAIEREGRRWRVPWRGLLAAVAVAVLLCWPYWNSIVAVQSVLEGFAGEWRNNDSLFSAFLSLTGGDAHSAARSSQWVLLGGIVAIWLARLPVTAAALAVICTLLLVAANCFPWYLTWMLPLLAVHPVPPLMLWTALVALAYHVVPGYEAAGTWEYDRWLVRLEYAPVLVWLAVVGGLRLWERFRPPAAGAR